MATEPANDLLVIIFACLGRAGEVSLDRREDCNRVGGSGQPWGTPGWEALVWPHAH